jgi:hypothetical protein
LLAVLFVYSSVQGQILISDAVLVGKTNGALFNAVQLKKTSMGDSSWYNLIYPYSDSDKTYFSTLDFKATEDDMQRFY